MSTDRTAAQAPGRLACLARLRRRSSPRSAYSAQLVTPRRPDDLAYRYSSSLAALSSTGSCSGSCSSSPEGCRARAFALKKTRSWPRALGLALAVLVVRSGPSALALAPLLDADEEQGLVPDEWDSSRAGAFVAFFLVVAVVAPAVEELTYRGLGFTLLAPLRRLGRDPGNGCALRRWPTASCVALPVLTVFGIAIGWLRARDRQHLPVDAPARGLQRDGAARLRHRRGLSGVRPALVRPRPPAAPRPPAPSSSASSSSRLEANSSTVTVSRNFRNSPGSRSARLDAVTRPGWSSSSAWNSIPDSSMTSSVAKICASQRTASAIASDGRESISTSRPSWTIVMRA